MNRSIHDFLLVSKISDTSPTPNQKPFLALSIFISMIIVTATGILPMLTSILVAGIALIGFKIITIDDAIKGIDFNVLLLLASALGIGAAALDIGLIDNLAEQIMSISSTPYIVLILLYASTLLLTELITNHAAAIIMTPIALKLAEHLQIDFHSFAITVMIAASASFMTPMGYQTNLMVMGPGGYRFIDYLKVGAPLSALVAGISILLIPIIWPF